MTEISKELIDAYRTTRYVVESAGGEFALWHIQSSREMQELYEIHQTDSALFITAWNPFSKVHDDEENRQANEFLREELEAHSMAIFSGRGVGLDPVWAPEESYLALGIDRQTSLSIGRQLGQNAIVHAGADAWPEVYWILEQEGELVGWSLAFDPPAAP